MVLVLTGFFLFGRQFICFWAGVDYDEAYTIAMLLFVPLTIPYIQNMGIIIIQARNQMKFRSLLYLIISLASFATMIPLSKLYGGVGCASAIAGALILGQIIIMNFYYFIKQKIDIVTFWIEITKMSIIPILLTIVSYNILTHFSLDSISKLFTGISLYLLVYIPLFFTFSMNKYERGLVLKLFKKLSGRG